MKVLTIFLLVSVICNSPWFENEKWVVEQQSVLTIYGKTNINNFQCRLPSKKESDTLIISLFNEKELIFERGRVKVDPTIFNCGNEFIKRDFLETLKADKYPYIFINFIDLKFIDFQVNDVNKARGHVNIYICGVNRVYDIDFELDQMENGKIMLNGHQALRLSEFNIETPSRMMGLIKVSDDIEIQFRLLMSKYQS